MFFAVCIKYSVWLEKDCNLQSTGFTWMSDSPNF
jgi:hypothetical protein